MKPIGLINHGNVCYLNSALQLLYSIKPLREYLLTNEFRKEINKENSMGSQGKYISTLADFFQQYSQGKPDTTKLLTLLSSMFQFGSQHDSHEVLLQLINTIHEDIKHEKTSPIKEMMFGCLTSKVSCLHCDYISETSSECSDLSLSIPKWSIFFSDIEKANLMTDVIVKIQTFYKGYRKGNEIKICVPRLCTKKQLLEVISQELKIQQTDIQKLFVEKNDLRREIYECDKINVTNSIIEVHSETNTFSMITSKQVTTDDALHLFSKPIIIPEWRCEKCNAHGGKKTLLYTQHPEYILIHIQLFEMGLYSYKKTSDHLTFPDEFEWKEASEYEHQKVIYEVVGTINHIGCSFFGHYYSFVKYEDQWYKCNDEIITPVMQKDIHTKDTYIILFKRKKN